LHALSSGAGEEKLPKPLTPGAAPARGGVTRYPISTCTCRRGSELWHNAAMRGVLNIIGGTLFFIAIINFMAFWIIAVSIGGDATSGKVDGGRHYVSNHGKLTEVSSSVWHYSRAHTISVWITHPLGIVVGGGLMALSRRLKKAA
jgi:hypothetical protein